jgi:hypothetical protein
MDALGMKKLSMIGLLVGAVFLGATVFSGAIASAAQTVGTTIVGPLDGQGNVKVHEQGTANVSVQGTVPVAPTPAPNAFSRYGGGSEDFCPNLPAGTNWYLSSISVINVESTERFGRVELRANPATGGQDGVFGPQLLVPALDTRQLTFPQPFVMRQQVRDMCLRMVAQPQTQWVVVAYHD